jgi:acetyl esterase/lipase
MDIYMPTAGTPPFPLLIWIHGGGWSGGTHDTVPASALALRSRGFAVASIGYRLSGVAIFPAQIHDVKGAVRYLRANAATYQLDSNRFGAWGSSAGGHLTALLATSGGVAALEGTSGGNAAFSSRVQAAVDYFGPTDIININLDVTTPPGSGIDHDAPTSPESNLVGWNDPGQGIGDIRNNLANPAAPYPQLVALCNQVNPITWVTADDPPMLIGHGTVDTSVPIMQSTRLANALASAGVANAYYQATGFGHGFLGNGVDVAAQNFFVAALGNVAQPLPGDANCDGAVNAGDIPAMVQAVANPVQYASVRPFCNPANTDLNHDLCRDGRDITVFVSLLTGP